MSLGSLRIAWRQFLRPAGTTPCWKAVHQSKDPTAHTVLTDDAAALAGLTIAAADIALSHNRNMPVLDGAVSVPIGLRLANVVTLLTWVSRGLLIDEGILPETAQAIHSPALAQPGVRDVERLLSRHVGPNHVLVTLDLCFDAGTDAAEAGSAHGQVERLVGARFPMIRRLFIQFGLALEPQRRSRPDAGRLPAETPADPRVASPPLPAP